MLRMGRRDSQSGREDRQGNVPLGCDGVRGLNLCRRRRRRPHSSTSLCVALFDPALRQAAGPSEHGLHASSQCGVVSCWGLTGPQHRAPGLPSSMQRCRSFPSARKEQRGLGFLFSSGAVTSISHFRPFKDTLLLSCFLANLTMTTSPCGPPKFRAVGQV